MRDRVSLRLDDIVQAINDVRTLLDGKSFSDLAHDRVVRAAFERFLEIISEASRHVPAEDKKKYSHIPWLQIADMGNHLRHAYHRTDPGILWDVYRYELEPLETAILSILHARKAAN